MKLIQFCVFSDDNPFFWIQPFNWSLSHVWQNIQKLIQNFIICLLDCPISLLYFHTQVDSYHMSPIFPYITIYTYIYIYTYVCIFHTFALYFHIIYIYIYIYIYVCICIYVCMYVYVPYICPFFSMDDPFFSAPMSAPAAQRRLEVKRHFSAVLRPGQPWRPWGVAPWGRFHWGSWWIIIYIIYIYHIYIYHIYLSHYISYLNNYRYTHDGLVHWG